MPFSPCLLTNKIAQFICLEHLLLCDQEKTRNVLTKSCDEKVLMSSRIACIFCSSILARAIAAFLGPSRCAVWKHILKILFLKSSWVEGLAANENKFKVCKSVHYHTVQINQPTSCNNFCSLLLDVYVQLNMFRASSRPSSGAQQLQWQPLVLPLERGGSSAIVRGRVG